VNTVGSWAPPFSGMRRNPSGLARCDTTACKGGRISERYSRPQLVEGQTIGRGWSFRDVT